MAHLQQQAFISKVKKAHPVFFKDKKVLGIGTFNVKGTESSYFSGGEFIGLDIGPGEGVDIVCPAQDYDAPDESFDCVISCECWEHNPFYKESIQNAVRLLRSGGLFLFTCATTGRPVHGTKTQDAIDQARGYTSQGNSATQWKTMPNVSREGWDNEYYRNVTESDVRSCVNIDNTFDAYEFTVEKNHCDLYFWGIKK